MDFLYLSISCIYQLFAKFDLKDIDVVADAEAIKTLLKLPYLSEPISMIVHRVGNTVLIDDFDLERLFCRYRVR